MNYNLATGIGTTVNKIRLGSLPTLTNQEEQNTGAAKLEQIRSERMQPTYRPYSYENLSPQASVKANVDSVYLVGHLTGRHNGLSAIDFRWIDVGRFAIF